MKTINNFWKTFKNFLKSDVGGADSPHTVADIDAILARVADFDRGEHFQQGLYRLNQHGWSLYDPVYSAHRSVLLRDVETGNINYAKHVGGEQQNGLKELFFYITKRSAPLDLTRSCYQHSCKALSYKQNFLMPVRTNDEKTF